MKKKKAFTLIELIAVLVILAILALIVTPLVMNIIRKARISADKRSIDAYGRSIELAIASYLLDEGKYPTSINELNIEYSGDRVECSTTQLNSDSSEYLTGCTVAGRTVDYEYGENKIPTVPTYTSYQVEDKILYNNVTYYVIEDSDTTKSTVKLLKENPLTKTETDSLGLTDVEIYNSGGYGEMEYGSSIDYESSAVKKVVDKWADSAVKEGDIAIARLITFDEVHSLGYSDTIGCGGACYNVEPSVPNWLYNSNYWYWTMSQYKESSSDIWNMYEDGRLYNASLSGCGMIRPVLEISKDALLIKVN